MSTPPFVIERTYHVPALKVWKALTIKEEMKRWYFDVSAFKPAPPLNCLRKEKKQD